MDNASPAQAPVPVATEPTVDTADDWDLHAKLDQKYYGNNSPTKRCTSSGVWNDVKRLREQHPLDPEGEMTHICIARISDGENGEHKFCNKLMKLHKNKPKNGGTPSWITTQAGNHLKEDHPIDSAAGANLVQKQQQRNDTSMEVALEYGMPNSDGKDIDSLSKFKLTKRERSLSSQVAERFVALAALMLVALAALMAAAVTLRAGAMVCVLVDAREQTRVRFHMVSEHATGSGRRGQDGDLIAPQPRHFRAGGVQGVLFVPEDHHEEEERGGERECVCAGTA